jgi:hypothetical protein
MGVPELGRRMAEKPAKRKSPITQADELPIQKAVEMTEVR